MDVTRLDQGEKRINEAHEWVSDLCTGKRRWQMRVPVEQTDSDITISEALVLGEQSARAVRAVLAACTGQEDYCAAERLSVPHWVTTVRQAIDEAFA